MTPLAPRSASASRSELIRWMSIQDANRNRLAEREELMRQRAIRGEG